MKAKLLLFALLTLSLHIDARCRRRRNSVVAGFLGAVTGATIAASAYGDQCYYQDGPQYNYIYAGAPRYVYDYPTYVYSPVYAYNNVRYTSYPSYFFNNNY